ncbi:glycosyltransferase [Photobacterium damselae]
MNNIYTESDRPLVSVIIPVYNGEKYIKKTIESILRQSYSNFELCIINDGSIDNTHEIISNYFDKRITYISRSNKGLSATLRELVDIASGDLIARIDADDMAHEDRLKLQVESFLRNKKLILAASNIEYIDCEDKILGRSLSVINDKNIKSRLLKGNIIFHPSVMFRRDVYYNVGGYDIVINKHIEDFLLWKKMSDYGEFHIINEYLTKYRVHSESITSNTPEKLGWLVSKVAKYGEYKDIYLDYHYVNNSQVINKSYSRSHGYKLPVNICKLINLIYDKIIAFKIR